MCLILSDNVYNYNIIFYIEMIGLLYFKLRYNVE